MQREIIKLITAKEFCEEAFKFNYKHYCGVPCSFLTPFINYVISHKEISYISSANEGDAVATAAGVAIGSGRAIAMMQNSGLGNAISPLTSLTYTFKIPVLIICTHRGDPELIDEPQHDLMGKITENLLNTINVKTSLFPRRSEDIIPTLLSIENHFLKTSLPFALIMKKGSVIQDAHNRLGTHFKSSYQKKEATNPPKSENKNIRVSRKNVLRDLVMNSVTNEMIFLATTGFTGRELYEIDDKENFFYMVGSMGCVSSLALGLAVAKPNLKILVLDGDGAALMRLGNLATIGAYKPKNFYHLLFDNESHESTGSQPTVSSQIDFSQIAYGCGYGKVVSATKSNEVIEALLTQENNGPIFIHIKTDIEKNRNLPRPHIKPPEQLRQLQKYIEKQSI